VPDNYLKIANGYATTSHSSQGLTANFAVVFGAAFDQKAIYVSHSRARERVDTYVPSKEAFLSRSERAQGDRLGVLEAIANARKEQAGEMLQGLKIGDKVNWAYEPRGGYAYTQQIAGVVTRLGQQKIQIRVAKRDGDKWVATKRWVKPENLSTRATRAVPEEAARVIEPAEGNFDESGRGVSQKDNQKDRLIAVNAAQQLDGSTAAHSKTQHVAVDKPNAGSATLPVVGAQKTRRTMSEEKEWLAVPYEDRAAVVLRVFGDRSMSLFVPLLEFNQRRLSAHKVLPSFSTRNHVPFHPAAIEPQRRPVGIIDNQHPRSDRDDRGWRLNPCR
jgi:hypothetical protein